MTPTPPDQPPPEIPKTHRTRHSTSFATLLCTMQSVHSMNCRLNLVQQLSVICLDKCTDPTAPNPPPALYSFHHFFYFYFFLFSFAEAGKYLIVSSWSLKFSSHWESNRCSCLFAFYYYQYFYYHTPAPCIQKRPLRRRHLSLSFFLQARSTSSSPLTRPHAGRLRANDDFLIEENPSCAYIQFVIPREEDRGESSARL